MFSPQHGEISGRRIINLDGQRVVDKKKFFDTGSTHVLEVEPGHVVKVRIKTHKTKFIYICTLNGMDMEKYVNQCSRSMVTWVCILLNIRLIFSDFRQKL